MCIHTYHHLLENAIFLLWQFLIPWRHVGRSCFPHPLQSNASNTSVFSKCLVDICPDRSRSSTLCRKIFTSRKTHSSQSHFFKDFSHARGNVTWSLTRRSQLLVWNLFSLSLLQFENGGRDRRSCKCRDWGEYHGDWKPGEEVGGCTCLRRDWILIRAQIKGRVN